jgi:hypothetical protein
VRFDRSQEPEAHDPEAARPEAHPPADPHALLALQRSAGNAAVGRMLARKFYAEAEDGSYVWHPEAVDESQWEDTGKTTRGWLWTYPVYRPKPKAAETAQSDAPAKSKRRRRKVKKLAPAETAAAPDLVEQDEEAVEDETEVAGPEETPPAVIHPEDDGGWATVKSARAIKAEREMNRDVDELADVIDAHEGEAAAIGVTFNQFFNARVRQGRETTGTIVSSYTTSFDRSRGGYSIEVEIPDLDAWVIHAHLDSQGALVPGENAVHYKRLAEVYSLGVSIALTPRQIGMLLPDEGTRAGWRTTQRRGTL